MHPHPNLEPQAYPYPCPYPCPYPNKQLAPELAAHARHLAASRDERAPTPYDVSGSFDSRARLG